MKIECDKCSAKYSIADEKVRGKTFKIRCKKCSNVIIVRDKSAAARADAGGGGADAAADQGAVGWHLAINGETVGPMPEEEVRQRYDVGEIDKDTAIWQEGFEDWIPLGDVDIFADLPDQPAAAGDDPFASANQDDYAAAGAAGAAAAMGGAAAAAAVAHESEPQSPRVSSLTGQRNENSVLFSLDSLQQIAQSGGGAAAPASRPAASTGASARGLATAAPGSEGSGLIDIRALGAMVGGDAGGGAAAPAGPVGGAQDDTALPSFGGAGLGGLASTPLVPQPSAEPAAAAAAAAAPPPARSNAPLYVLMVVLIVAVAGLGAFIFLNKQDPVIVEKTVAAPPPTVAGAGKDDEDDKDKDKDKDKDDEDEDEDEDADKDDEEGDSADADEADDGSGKSSSKKKSRSRKGDKRSSSKSSSSGLPDLPDPEPTKTSKSSSSKKDDNLDVDCILDPAKCGKGGSPKKKGPPKGATDPNLPEKLSTSDIKAGIAPVKSAAKSCGSKHNAPPGTKVKVKISISGATGTVSSATAQAPHTGTALGNCVASAVKKAKFKKFRKSSLGAVYPFSM